MRRGDRREIDLPDGTKVEAEYLGKGRHCTAYRRGDDVYCFVVEGDYSKELISYWIGDDAPHVPKVEDLGEVVRRGEYRKVYRMPYYPNITAKDKDAWKVLGTLREAADRAYREKYLNKERGSGRHPLEVWGLYFANDVIEDTRGKVPESVTEALTALMDAMSNYGCGWAFEFGRRNIGVDGQGRIVFRDICFDAESVARERREKTKARRSY